MADVSLTLSLPCGRLEPVAARHGASVADLLAWHCARAASSPHDWALVGADGERQAGETLLRDACKRGTGCALYLRAASPPQGYDTTALDAPGSPTACGDELCVPRAECASHSRGARLLPTGIRRAAAHIPAGSHACPHAGRRDPPARAGTSSEAARRRRRRRGTSAHRPRRPRSPSAAASPPCASSSAPSSTSWACLRACAPRRRVFEASATRERLNFFRLSRPSPPIAGPHNGRRSHPRLTPVPRLPQLLRRSDQLGRFGPIVKARDKAEPPFSLLSFFTHFSLVYTRR